MARTEYDPFAAIAAARHQLEQTAELDRQKEEREREFNRAWNDAWLLAIESPGADRLLRLGEVIEAADCTVWAELFDCRLSRLRYVLDVEHSGESLSPAFNFHSAAISLVKAGIGQNGSQADVMLSMISRDDLPGVVDGLREVFRSIDQCRQEVYYPATPLMTRQELAAACRSRLPDFDEPGISKKLKAGRLAITKQYGKTRGGWFEFRVPQADIHDPGHDHAKMLRCAIEHVRKCKKTGFFFQQVWPPKTDALKSKFRMKSR